MHLFGHHHGNHVGHEHEAEDGPAKAGPAADPRSQRP
jgi:hypothetical protein